MNIELKRASDKEYLDSIPNNKSKGDVWWIKTSAPSSRLEMFVIANITDHIVELIPVNREMFGTEVHSLKHIEFVDHVTKLVIKPFRGAGDSLTELNELLFSKRRLKWAYQI